MIKYLFPFGLVKPGSDIILYGAGAVGTDFYAQIAATNFCNVVLWVDQRHIWCRNIGLDVQAPESIKDVKYDYVVAAIENFNRIKPTILEMGVNPDKIIWSDRYIVEKQPIKSAKFSSVEPIKMKATDLLSSKRMDIIVRYLLARDIHNRVHNQEHLSLYERFIMVLCGAEEPMNIPIISALSEYSEKKTIPGFVDALKKLVVSMEKNGFLKEYYLSLDDRRTLVNGSHRLATALALEQGVWAGQIEGLIEAENIGDIKWFEENSFSETDKMRILCAFADLYPDSTILVMFGACNTQWDIITETLSERINMAGSADICLCHDRSKLANLFHEIYREKPQHDREQILKTCIQQNPPKIRICLFTDELDKGCDIYEQLAAIKQQIYGKALAGFPAETKPYLMFAAENPQEQNRLKEILHKYL